MSPTGMDVILYEYMNRFERENFIGLKRDSVERLLAKISAGLALSVTDPTQDYERARKALEIQL